MNDYDGELICNVADHMGLGGDSRWPDGAAPWSVTSLMPGVTEDDYRKACAWSLAQWAAAGGINPKEVGTARLARILATSRTIDGPAHVLGETELPNLAAQQVRMWLDTSESWDVAWPPADPHKIPLYLTVLHELGHALGIGHAPQGTTAVMSPYLQSQLRGLQPWDVQEIRRRYGAPVTPPPPVPIPAPIPGGPMNGIAFIVQIINFINAHPEIVDLIKRLLGLFQTKGALTLEDVVAEASAIQELRA